MSPVLLQTDHAHFACFANEQKVFQLLNRLLKMYFWSLFFFFCGCYFVLVWFCFLIFSEESYF